MLAKTKLKKPDILHGINGYYLELYDTTPPYDGIIGCFKNTQDKNLKINIEVYDEYLLESNITTCVFLYNRFDFDQSIIALTSSFYSEILKNDYLKFSLWHELGHYHTIRCFDKEGTSNQERREKYFKMGEIVPEEKAADLFAYCYTSKEYVCKKFNYFIRKRRDVIESNIFHNEPESYIQHNNEGLRELTRRKRYLMELDDSKESILKELCNVCGVEYIPEKLN